MELYGFFVLILYPINIPASSYNNETYELKMIKILSLA